MKKSLLLAAALVATLGASAQGEKAYFASNLSGLTTTISTVTAGTACGSTSLVDATIGADDSYKLVSINGPKNADGSQSYKNLTIDGVTLSETEPGLDQGGVQGNTNPKDVDGGTPSGTLKAPASGAFFQFKAKASGYLYIVAKMSSNKAYTVFEEGSALPYQYVQAAESPLPQVLSYDLTGTGTVSDEAEYLTTTDHPKGIYWPEQIASGITGYAHDGVVDTTATNGQTPISWKKIGKNGVGVIAFPIFEDLTYIVNANGSKISGLGFYTSTEKAKDITLTTDNASDPAIVLVKDGVLQGGSATTGISKITKDSKDEFNALDPIYNLAGQRVSGAYKGVVIQNGHKFIRK